MSLTVPVNYGHEIRCIFVVCSAFDPQRGHIEEVLAGFQRADDHQNKINCVVPVPVSENPRNLVMLSVPPSAMLNTTQFTKTRFVALLKTHPM